MRDTAAGVARAITAISVAAYGTGTRRAPSTGTLACSTTTRGTLTCGTTACSATVLATGPPTASSIAVTATAPGSANPETAGPATTGLNNTNINTDSRNAADASGPSHAGSDGVTTGRARAWGCLPGGSRLSATVGEGGPGEDASGFC